MWSQEFDGRKSTRDTRESKADVTDATLLATLTNSKAEVTDANLLATLAKLNLPK